MRSWNQSRNCPSRNIYPDPQLEPPRFFDVIRNLSRDAFLGRGSAPELCKTFQNPSILGPEPEPPELGHFSVVGAAAGAVGTLNLEPEPEPGLACFSVFRARAVQNFPGSASLLLVIQRHSTKRPFGHSASLAFWLPDDFLANRYSLVHTAYFWQLAQSVRLPGRTE